MRLALLATLPSRTFASIVLSKELMNLAKESAVLSAMAYDTSFISSEFQDFEPFTDEPDQALFVKKTVGGNDYCFGVFRGTTMTWVDWQQNFDPKSQEVCVAVGGHEQCCVTRNGFFDAYSTSYASKLEERLRECAKTCTNKDECVVLTGHSQGGAVAAVAGLLFADLNPYVVTFGQPTTIDKPCPLVTSQRWFRFVNTKSSEKVGITYDPVPFSPGLGADSFGHMIILGDDTSGVAYIGLDAQDFFSPLNVLGFEAHSMISTTAYPGYLDRLEALMANGTYPIRNNGYVAGSLCSEDKECESTHCGAETHFSFKRCIGINCKTDDDCVTDRCDSGMCLPKLGSCAPCDEASDCEGSQCLMFKCSNADGLMDNFCTCKWDVDCESGRCEGVAPPICQAQLGIGASCNADSDCLSNHCTWSFVCGAVPVVASATVTTRDAALVPVVTLVPTIVETPAPVPTPVATPGPVVTPVVVAVSKEITTDDSSASSGASIPLILFAILVVAILGFFVIRKCILWRQGYEEIPSTSMDV